MAGINWSKLTAQAAAGLSVHLDADQRRKHRHANKDIDTSRADLNYSLGCASYKDALRSARQRVREVDAVAPPKRVTKDRITAVSLVAYCPPDIPQDEFFRALDEIYRARWGADYHGMQVHLDEVHKYFDKSKGGYVQSRAHSHALITPYATWRDKHTVNGVQYNELRRGINGKHFMTKQAMTDLNKAVDDMCRERWGVPYMTGERRRGKDTDVIKRDSLRAEIVHLAERVRALQKRSEMLLDAIEGTLDQLPDPELGQMCLDYLCGSTIDTDALEDALRDYQPYHGRER